MIKRDASLARAFAGTVRIIHRSGFCRLPGGPKVVRQARAAEIWTLRSVLMTESCVAYFSMEVGLESSMPTYSGGLGVLAGDTLRAAADFSLPLVAISLVHRKGYFVQSLDGDGNQREFSDPWTPEDRLEEMETRIAVTVEGRTVSVRAWRYSIRGFSGFEVPVYLLDTLLPDNSQADQALTDHLYGGDLRYRLSQEVVLGAGGVAMLEALGYENIRVYHMNEGHSALLAMALLERENDAEKEAIRSVRKRCVFTTHTPVPAGHDQFPIDLARRVLGRERADRFARIGCCLDGVLNLTHVGLFFSHYINGVAMRHSQISRGMFPGYPISSITNGVHAVTWTSAAFRELYDHYISDWRRQNVNLRYAISIPTDRIREAHEKSKSDLLTEVEKRSGIRLKQQSLTLGFARRATSYKRADLLVSRPDRLRALTTIGSLQIVYAGKAHPRDEGGKEMIRRVFERAAEVESVVDVVYLEDYDMDLGRLMCSGVDLWINTPRKPEEASGTSGMKAALNGVPSLSVLDGWWIEGHVEGVTGWCVGESWERETDPLRASNELYRKLEDIAAMFYGNPEAYLHVMRHAIALNGAFFNAQRMIDQYAQSAYEVES